MKQRCCSALVLLLVVPTAFSIELTLDTESLSGPGWQAENIGIVLAIGADPKSNSLLLDIEQLTLAAFALPLTKVSLRCQDIVFNAQQLLCNKGDLRVQQLLGKALNGALGFSYQFADAALQFRLSNARWADAELTLAGQSAVTAWQLNLVAQALDAALLQSFQVLLPFPLAQIEGRLAARAKLQGNNNELAALELQLNTENLSFSDEAGLYAGEDLQLSTDTRWNQDGTFQSDVQLGAGQLYLEPLFWQQHPRAKPIILNVAGDFSGRRLNLSQLNLSHQRVLRASGQAIYDLDLGMQQVDLQIEQAILPAFYQHYIQPFVSETVFGDLTTIGSVQGRVAIADKRLTVVDISFNDVGFSEGQRLFGLQGLRGNLAWNLHTDAQRSQLQWTSGNLYRLPVGPSQLALESQAGSWRLLQNNNSILRIPLLDGALRIDRLQGQGLSGADLGWRFNGQIEPISLASLSQILDWPPLAGQLAGVIPEVRYQNGQLQVGGVLLLKIFGGEITVANLRAEQPFGDLAQVFADMDLYNLDLQTLTETFDVGKIEGKLGGQVRGLVLQNWRPTRFDAFLYTPKGDKSRRRISQRAVETISDLGGGGAAGILSRGFLGLFDEFRYRRLGWRCQLRNGICSMDGIAPSPNAGGYYLVEGSGLPRIDVIGFNRQVGWIDLLTRLQAAAQSEGPEVR